MYIIKGTGRIVLVFDSFVIKLSRSVLWIKRAKNGFNQYYKYMSFKEGIKEYFRLLFFSIKNNWSEFVFYQKTHHTFCTKTYFSFFGLFNIQERVIHLKGNDPKDQYHFSRKEEYDLILKKVIISRRKDVEAHTFFDPINFGFSKKTGKFVCVDYEEPMVQENILEFGEKLQEAFKDFDNRTKPLE